MIKKELSRGFYRYAFEPLPGKHFGNVIYLLLDGDSALLIDTGYEFEAVEILEDLTAQGYRLEAVVISHFHDDHMEGLKILPRVVIYGSARYQITLDLETAKEEHSLFTPTAAIATPTSLRFGKHRIEMIPFPGHSACTLLTRINDTWLHIADELIFCIDGAPLLPIAEPGGIPQHMDSLNKLLDYSELILLPSHGPELQGRDKLQKEIQNRLTYLQAILRSDRQLTYEEATRDCDCTFLHSEWHRYAYQ